MVKLLLMKKKLVPKSFLFVTKQLPDLATATAFNLDNNTYCSYSRYCFYFIS